MESNSTITYSHLCDCSSAMDLHDKESPWSFTDEERKNCKVRRRLSFGNHPNISDQDIQFVRARSSSGSANSIPQWPMSPGTPYMLSPVHVSPSQSLLYNCLASLHHHEGNIFSIAVSNDFIFTSSESKRIHAWRQPDCMEVGHIKANAGQILPILAYGKILFTTHGDHRIRLWDMSTTDKFCPRKITTLPPRNLFPLFSRKSKTIQHKDHISCIAYNHAEKLLYTGSYDKTVKVWNVSENRCDDTFLAHDGHVNAIVLNQEDGCVFTCSSDGTVKIWRRVFERRSHILTMTLKFQLSPVNALALSLVQTTCFLYSGSSDGLISFWQKERMSGRFNHGGILQGHHFAVLCMVTLGDLVLSGSEDTTIRVWRREEKNWFHSCLAVIDGHRGPVRCLAATMEMETRTKNLLVYSASSDQTFKVWRVNVFPTEKVNSDNAEAKDQKTETVDFAVNPVLSPSWVKKKIQGIHFQW